eukprot:9504913-Alexandrium_andersonii.AAC.1
MRLEGAGDWERAAACPSSQGHAGRDSHGHADTVRSCTAGSSAPFCPSPYLRGRLPEEQEGQEEEA